MTLKRRLDSNWKNIRIVDEEGVVTGIYDLDRYGRLTTKFEKKTPRNIKLLLSNSFQKQAPTPTKPFVLPKISPPPIQTPIIPSQSIEQNNIMPKMPQINLNLPQPILCGDNTTENESADDCIDSSSEFFIDNDEFLYDADPFNGLDLFDISMDDINFNF